MDHQHPVGSASVSDNASDLRWWQPVLFGALAGGMAWGIRGQYGHETGAMIAGLLMSLVLAHLFRPHAATLPVARAVAWCTVAIGFGGSMTYGQTIGLTQDAPLIGNWAALAWGMLGLALKGGIWIGFAGVFLGMGLSGRQYRPLGLLLLMALAYEEQIVGRVPGWIIYVLIPLALTAWAAARWSRDPRPLQPSHRFTCFTLVLVTWLYFSLNFALFRFPWPWAAWTQRTPSALVFLACAVGLTVVALVFPSRRQAGRDRLD